MSSVALLREITMRSATEKPALCALLAAGITLAGGCSEDVDRDTELTTTTAGTMTGTSSGTPAGTVLPANGWETAYEHGGVGTDCTQSAAEMEGAGVPHLTFGGTALFVGFEQNGDNQNPVFARFDRGTQSYCEHHETEAPDGRAVGLTWNGGDVAYVVYTIVGGGSALEGRDGWLSSYAPGAISGGGPKVSFVGKVEVPYGTLQSGTFIIAVTSDNHVNSHGPAEPPTVALTMTDSDQIQFLGASAHKPIDADGAHSMDCTDYPFDSRYRFSLDLDQIICADCSNCISQQPCP